MVGGRDTTEVLGASHGVLPGAMSTAFVSLLMMETLLPQWVCQALYLEVPLPPFLLLYLRFCRGSFEPREIVCLIKLSVYLHILCYYGLTLPVLLNGIIYLYYYLFWCLTWPVGACEGHVCSVHISHHSCSFFAFRQNNMISGHLCVYLDATPHHCFCKKPWFL